VKRFVAGATCPECKQTDSLYFETEEPEDRVHCTRCEYSSLRGENFVADNREFENDEFGDDSDKEIKWH